MPAMQRVKGVKLWFVWMIPVWTCHRPTSANLTTLSRDTINARDNKKVLELDHKSLSISQGVGCETFVKFLGGYDLTRVQKCSALSHLAVSFKLPHCKHVFRVRRRSFAFWTGSSFLLVRTAHSLIFFTNQIIICLLSLLNQNSSTPSYLLFSLPSYSRIRGPFIHASISSLLTIIFISMGKSLIACLLLTLIAQSFSLPLTLRSSIERGNSLSASVSAGIVIAICMSYLPLSSTLI